MVYKGELIASGEAKAVRSSLEDVWSLKGTKLADALESIYLRVSALRKWKDKFDKKFNLHFDGEFLIKSKGGVQKLQGTGGHNHSVIGENIRVRKYLTQPKNNIPFDALISVRYSARKGYGRWIEKQAKSSMFPTNWDITRVKQEIALVYEKMIQSSKFDEIKNMKSPKYKNLDSNNKFEIVIEFDQFGNLTNAYPNIR